MNLVRMCAGVRACVFCYRKDDPLRQGSPTSFSKSKAGLLGEQERKREKSVLEIQGWEEKRGLIVICSVSFQDEPSEGSSARGVGPGMQ